MHVCTYDEWKLLDRAEAGDSRAFDRLFALHRETIQASLWHLLGGDRELVDEVVGAVFLHAFVALPGFRRQAAFSTWLFRIAIREAQAQRKGAKEQQQRTIRWENADLATAGYADPEAQFFQAEDKRRLHQALYALPEPYRTPLLLRYRDTLTSVEIALRLNRPEGTVRHQISRGLKILRERFVV